jgi:uncharacterized protein YjbJ (UPF0337 family)
MGASDKARNKAHKIAGEAEAKIGRTTGNHRMGDEGKAWRT